MLLWSTPARFLSCRRSSLKKVSQWSSILSLQPLPFLVDATDPLQYAGNKKHSAGLTVLAQC